ncbi:MAG: Uncharacterized MFS-type transporter, partial [uncultured Actinomycetospora sp.]
ARAAVRPGGGARDGPGGGAGSLAVRLRAGAPRHARGPRVVLRHGGLAEHGERDRLPRRLGGRPGGGAAAGHRDDVPAHDRRGGGHHRGGRPHRGPRGAARHALPGRGDRRGGVRPRRVGGEPAAHRRRPSGPLLRPVLRRRRGRRRPERGGRPARHRRGRVARVGLAARVAGAHAAGGAPAPRRVVGVPGRRRPGPGVAPGTVAAAADRPDRRVLHALRGRLHRLHDVRARPPARPGRGRRGDRGLLDRPGARRLRRAAAVGAAAAPADALRRGLRAHRGDGGRRGRPRARSGRGGGVDLRAPLRGLLPDRHHRPHRRLPPRARRRPLDRGARGAHGGLRAGPVPRAGALGAGVRRRRRPDRRALGLGRRPRPRRRRGPAPARPGRPWCETRPM